MASLQEQVFNYLLKQIEQGKNNYLLPSQNELCRHFGVSTVTVRGAFAKLEKQGLISRQQGKGCFIRKVSAATGPMRLFIIIAPETDLNSEFVTSLVNASRKHAYHTIFYHFDGNEDILFYELAKIEPKVVLWMTPSLYLHRKTIQKLLSMPFYLMLFNRIYDHLAISYVSGDFIADGRKMGEILAASGVRNVLYLGYDMHMMYAKYRYDGIVEVLQKVGGKVSVIDARPVPQSDMIACDKSLLIKASECLRKEAFDAIVCAQGKIWNTLMRLLQTTRIDSSAMWFGTFNCLSETEWFSPRIVVLNQQVANMAEEAIQLATRLLKTHTAEHLLFQAVLQTPPKNEQYSRQNDSASEIDSKIKNLKF